MERNENTPVTNEHYFVYENITYGYTKKELRNFKLMYTHVELMNTHVEQFYVWIILYQQDVYSILMGSFKRVSHNYTSYYS